MKKRWIMFASLILAFALVFTGCGGGEDAEDAEKQDKAVTEGAISEDADEGETEDNQVQPASQNDVTGTQQTPEPKTEQKSGKTTKTQQPASNSASDQKPAAQPKSEQPSQQPASEPASAPEPAPTPEPAPSAPTKSDAAAYKGSSKSSLVAGIGSPNSSSYSPSCMGDGEDGELHYNGFTVYTYRENGSETVTDVI